MDNVRTVSLQPDRQDATLQATRLMTKVAWLYHMRGLRQREIGSQLGLSQSRVSRLLEQAVTAGIVQTVVVAPEGLHAGLEGELEQHFELREAHVFDVAADPDDESELIDGLGRLVAARLRAHPPVAKVLGLTSWSRSLRVTVAALQPMRATVEHVVELLGDVGPVSLRNDATEATRRLADVTGATPHFLRTPGVVPDRSVAETLLAYDHDATESLELLDRLDVALVGVGNCEIVEPLTAGGNFFTEEQFAHARSLGAVGQVNLRFLAEDGSPVPSELDDMVIGATLDQLKRCPRVLAVAGGPTKYAAIRAALLGGWVTSLVTDLATAEHLLTQRSS